MKLGVLSDLHWSVAPDASARWHAPYDFDGLAARCAETVGALAARGCDVLVVAGDVTHDGDRASCEAALDCILSVSPIPVAVVEGNHDVRLERALVPRRADVCDGWGRAEALAHEELVALRAIGVDRDGRWARDCGPSLAADGLATVVVSHYPLVPHADRLAVAGLPFPGELADRGLWLELLAATGMPTVVLSGHVHVRDTACHDNVLQICVPALVERPHEAAVVDVDPLGGVVRCTRIDGKLGAASARGAEPWLLAPADERWTFAGGSWTGHEVEAPRRPVLAEA